MTDSTDVSDASPTANMYGCEPCPKCGSKYRCVFNEKPNLIQCDDCGENEMATVVYGERIDDVFRKQ